ncbi:hypothetical protein AB0K45_09665 [Micrococcus luteus]|uniref:hypothetical protein n=1 Tax=Micrococcus luteus TaxID=1270 RepID=UPI00342BD0AF
MSEAVLVEVKPRGDNRFDIYVGDFGDAYLNSSQGYENVEDAVRIVRKLWPPFAASDQSHVLVEVAVEANPVAVPRDDLMKALTIDWAPVVLRVTYRDGTQKTEQLR